MGSFESQLVFEQDYGSELGCIVFNIEAVRLALDDGVAPTYADVVDPYLRLVTPSQFELTLLVGDGQQVDVPRGVLVQRHGLQQNVVVVCLGGDFVRQINDFVNFLPNFKRMGYICLQISHSNLFQ